VNAPAPSLGPDVCGDEQSQTRRVDVGHIVQVDHDLDVAPLCETFDDLLNGPFARTAIEFAGQLEHGDVFNQALDDLHGGSPCLCEIPYHEDGHVVVLFDCRA
jgi:hypothetical protein